jgi:NAD(P)H-flavin reductase
VATFFTCQKDEQGILLVGTGTGLAPGHSGPIYLFHGSRESEDIYRVDEMRQLSAEHPNFHYLPCLSGHRVPEGFIHGRAHEVALATLADLKGWWVFLCGHPDMVRQMQRMAFLKGAASADIYADAFLVTPT